jgi:hypothetical protein
MREGPTKEQGCPLLRAVTYDHVPVAIRIAHHMAKEDLRVLLCGPCGVYPERAIWTVRDVKPPAARERLLSEAGRQVSFSGPDLMRGMYATTCIGTL